MNYLKLFFSLILLLLVGVEAQASHAAGGDLSYTCLGNNRYQVQLRLYRDCDGINLSTTASVDVTGFGSCAGSSNIQLGLTSVIEIPIACNAMLGQSSCNGGTLPGYEEYTYIGTLDMSAFPTGCTWAISYNSCCRNASITNLQNPSTQSFYLETALTDSTASCNSSPSFANRPIFVVCDSMPTTISNSTIEADGDSVVYSLAPSLTNNGAPISYVGGFSPSYFLNTLSGGLNFDSNSGQLSFTPATFQVVSADIYVEEYRNGQLIGYTRRNLQIIVNNCNNQSIALTDVSEVVNGVPQSQGLNTTFYACPGEDLEFQLTLNDPDNIDSITLIQSYASLLNIYPNASITVNYPIIGTASTALVNITIPTVQNNIFSLAVTDNACPLANTQGYAFQILPDTNCVSITGRVAIDSNANCLVSPLENPFSEAIVIITKGNFTTYATPNANGYYSATLDTGVYTVNVSPIQPYWASCANNVTASALIPGSSTSVDFPMEVLVSCPFMYVDIAAPVLVHCMSSYYEVDYCNYGTIDGVNAYVEVTLDSLFVIDSTNLPIASQNGFTYTFNLDTVAVGQCGSFRIYGTLDSLCDSTNFGLTHCANAHIYPDSICLTHPLWNGANLEVEAQCNGDSVAFRIVNTGLNQMISPQNYWVIEDDIIFYTGPGITLPGGGATPWQNYPANGATYRMAITQVPNHPWGTQASATVEGCLASTSPGPVSLGFVNIFSLNDASPFYSIDCQQNVGSWDPNDKQGFPNGYGTPHYIEDETQLEYRIRFQNTGTYPATNVVIVDTLSSHLDPTSIIPTVSSHNYTWRMLGDGIIEFRFNNIMLPDSGSNQMASHGFVDFRIEQKPNNPNGTVIYNQAAIYFDLNAAVITNQTYHTIGEHFIQVLGVEEVLIPNVAVKVFPNPFQESTTLQIESEHVYENISLRVFDATGKLIQVIENSNEQLITLHRQNMAQGIYFYRLEADGQLLNAGKLIVN